MSDSGTTEVILGTNLTVEGQATADYLCDLLQDKPVTISRLARGVPAGGELEYMDANTLTQAFSDRRTLYQTARKNRLTVFPNPRRFSRPSNVSALPKTPCREFFRYQTRRDLQPR